MRSGGKKKKKRSQFIQMWLYLHRAAFASQGGRFHLSEMNHLISLKFATGGSSRDVAGLSVSFCSSYFTPTTTPPHPPPARNRCHDKRRGNWLSVRCRIHFPPVRRRKRVDGRGNTLSCVTSGRSRLTRFHFIVSFHCVELICAAVNSDWKHC